MRNDYLSPKTQKYDHGNDMPNCVLHYDLGTTHIAQQGHSSNVYKLRARRLLRTGMVELADEGWKLMKELFKLIELYPKSGDQASKHGEMDHALSWPCPSMSVQWHSKES